MKKSNQIVFVNQSSGYLMVDIVNAFNEQFDERILATGFLNERNNKLDKNVKVEKLIKYNRTSSIMRLFTWSWSFLKVLFLVKTKYRKAHLFLVSNPPFATLLPIFCKNSFDVLIYDIYPDALIEFKILSSDSILVKYWANSNKKIFKRARKIFTISEPMKDRLTNYVTPDKIEVVSIWTDNNFLKPIEKKQNMFLQNLGLQDKFLVVYSGNMGKSHPVGKMVELAELFKSHNDIYFLLIGAGHQYANLEEEINKSQLDNIRLLPWQPTELLPYTLSAPDLALVTIGNEASDLSIPSKLFNFMSTATPILSIAPETSALAKLVVSEQIGQSFNESQLELISDFILKCKSDKEYYQRLVSNAINTSSKYSSENALKFI